MAAVPSDEIKRDAGRTAQTVDRIKRQAAPDFGVGLGTLNKLGKPATYDAGPPEPAKPLARD